MNNIDFFSSINAAYILFGIVLIAGYLAYIAAKMEGKGRKS